MTEQPQEKQEFKSNLDGWTHVMVLDHEGKPHTQPVPPQGTVWLTALEQQLTANMHEKPEDNPFLDREHVHIDPKTLDEVNRFTAPTFQLVNDGEFAGRPTGAAQLGRFSPGEVVGTA